MAHFGIKCPICEKTTWAKPPVNWNADAEHFLRERLYQHCQGKHHATLPWTEILSLNINVYDESYGNEARAETFQQETVAAKAQSAPPPPPKPKTSQHATSPWPQSVPHPPPVRTQAQPNTVGHNVSSNSGAHWSPPAHASSSSAAPGQVSVDFATLSIEQKMQAIWVAILRIEERDLRIEERIQRIECRIMRDYEIEHV